MVDPWLRNRLRVVAARNPTDERRVNELTSKQVLHSIDELGTVYVSGEFSLQTFP